MIRVDYTNCFGDKRLDRRGAALHTRLFQSSTRSIKGLSKDWAEQKGYYRFLHHEKTSEAKLVEEMTQRCGRAAEGRIVLSIQDTSEVDVSAHMGRLRLQGGKADSKEEHTEKGSGLGPIDNNRGGIGFKLHPSLVVDAGSCFPLGFSAIRLWNRPMQGGDKHERQYGKLPIEQKESYKWIESCGKTKQTLGGAKAVVIVQDREGDIFEQFFHIPDEKTFLLVRSFTNRTTTSAQKLWTVLEQSPLQGCYQTHIPADSHSRQPARQATIEVRVAGVEIKAPVRDRQNRGRTVNLYAIEAREVNTAAPEPILWRLLTTWPVTSYQEALQVIEWYSWRWFIEELFRMLKKEGFDIEGSELESGWAIRKLTLMLLDVIIKLMQMHIAYSEPEDANVPLADWVFNPEEQQCLKGINNKVEGKTEALKNPYPPQKLNHATWIIARLGGWKGYKSQHPPGMTILFNGLKKFYDLFDGWSLQKDVGTR